MIFDQAPIDASMEEPLIVFNPTDFFRDTIYTTDFSEAPIPAVVLTDEVTTEAMDFA